MKNKTIRLIIPISIAITAVIAFQIGPKFHNRIEIKKQEKINQETLEEAKSEENTPRQSIPKKAFLEVNFICQAPLETVENWTQHEESCEEAALLQAYLYEKKSAITKEEANKEILKMIAWQKQQMGEHKDLYADEFKNFVMGYYNLKDKEVIIKHNATIPDIKEAISNSHPVIVPITGEILQNPYYPYPGYHMLVVTGYTEDRIITNDNGTKNGESYSYPIERFEKAMQDAEDSIIILNID